LIMLVSSVKSGERWITFLLITLVSIVKSGEIWIISRINNAGINSEVRGKLDKKSY